MNTSLDPPKRLRESLRLPNTGFYGGASLPSYCLIIMNGNPIFVVRLPAPLQQQKLLAEIAYRWVAVVHLLLLTVALLVALSGV